MKIQLVFVGVLLLTLILVIALPLSNKMLVMTPLLLFVTVVLLLNLVVLLPITGIITIIHYLQEARRTKKLRPILAAIAITILTIGIILIDFVIVCLLAYKD